MKKNYPFDELKQLLDQNPSVTIFLPVNPQFDQVAAALALKLALEKSGKPAAVLSPTPMTVEFSQLVGVDTIGRQNDTGQNLVISFNYPLEQIEKISYNDEGGKLNLVIQPKVGSPRVEKEQAEFFYEGENQSLQIIIGGDGSLNLGKLSQGINLNNVVTIRKTPGENYGRLSIIDPYASSYSEIITAIVFNLGFMVDEDIANNLYLGLKKATQNFSSENVGPDTFEAAASCLRWGAKKSISFSPQQPVFEEKKQFSKKQTYQKTSSQPSAPSPDWLEPKIFKSSNV